MKKRNTRIGNSTELKVRRVTVRALSAAAGGAAHHGQQSRPTCPPPKPH